MCHLKVVLMCSGNGSDPSTYKPHRDESQWWNRRDALVRCVSAFLLGPAASTVAESVTISGNVTSHRELVLLFDGDLSRTHMQWNPFVEQPKTKSTAVSPCESVIVELWKRAVTKQHGKSSNFALHKTEQNDVVTTVTETGTLSCHHIPFHSTSKKAPTTNSKRKGGISPPSGMESKRGLLEYLQQECSLEFLRQHGLNSSFDVILRKTNKQKLMTVLRAWQKQTSTTHHNDENNTQNKGQAAQQSAFLQSIFVELLQPLQPDMKVIAATLHESSDSELPCYSTVSSEKKRPSKLQVCLFLGAVRDMEKLEYQALQMACQQTKQLPMIPLVRVRLSPVSEFTSKILSVVAFHHAQGVLGESLEKLVQVQNEKTAAAAVQCNPNKKGDDSTLGNKRKRHVPPADDDNDNHKDDPLEKKTLTSSLNQHHLHVLCIVPLPAKDVVLDLKHRNGTLWRLVRITVCTLWRSRLASRQQQQQTDISISSLQTSLTLVFQDGSHVTMQQDDLVSSLAEQHQAAPSEFQILKALIAKCCANKTDNSTSDTAVSWKALARQIIQEVTPPNTRKPPETNPAVNVISIEPIQVSLKNLNKRNHLTTQFYSNPAAFSPLTAAKKTIVLVPIHADDDSCSLESGEFYPSAEFLQHCITNQFRRPPHLLRVFEQNILSSSCEDMEACTITVLQHFFYQNRVFLPQTTGNDKKVMERKKNKTDKQ